MADVYGTYQIFDAAKDLIVAAMNTLKTAMASGYDPTFSYVYSHHCPAELRLNAVSVDFDGSERAPHGSYGQAPTYIYLMQFSIRVHTNYQNQFNDNEKNTRLLNSIDNYLSTHLDLGSDYRIREISEYNARQVWSDSATVGGELTVTVQKVIDHTQA